jgi:3-hydroxyacyl-[acyl-carrier-protein] dehydratase
MRWIWIDRFEAFESGRMARTVKNITFAEEHVHDPTPSYPLFPSSLIIEGLAQTAGLLVGESRDFQDKVILAKLPRMEFFGHAVPGDTLTYEAHVADIRAEGAAVVDVRALRGNQTLAEGEIVFAFLTAEQAPIDLGDSSFVFAGPMRALIRSLRAAEARSSRPDQEGQAP